MGGYIEFLKTGFQNPKVEMCFRFRNLRFSNLKSNTSLRRWDKQHKVAQCSTKGNPIQLHKNVGKLQQSMVYKLDEIKSHQDIINLSSAFFFLITSYLRFNWRFWMWRFHWRGALCIQSRWNKCLLICSCLGMPSSVLTRYSVLTNHHQWKHY